MIFFLNADRRACMRSNPVFFIIVHNKKYISQNRSVKELSIMLNVSSGNTICSLKALSIQSCNSRQEQRQYILS